MTGHGRTTPERDELSPDELNDVSGGVVCITAHSTEIHTDSVKITRSDGGGATVGRAILE